jgi:hypothetical protein
MRLQLSTVIDFPNAVPRVREIDLTLTVNDDARTGVPEGRRQDLKKYYAED